MAGNIETVRGRHGNLWRIAVWGTAAFLLLLPLIAMRFTNEVDWTAADFTVMGAMLAALCGGLELGVKLSDNIAYRAGFGVAVVTSFLLVWVNLAVGFIGDEDNPANLLFGGVLAIGIVGSALARFRPNGMALALAATALAQASVAAFALAAGWDIPLIPSAVFVALWLGSAWLFRQAARDRIFAGAAPQA